MRLSFELEVPVRAGLLVLFLRWAEEVCENTAYELGQQTVPWALKVIAEIAFAIRYVQFALIRKLCAINDYVDLKYAND